jgi:phage baseplate assembly protein W
VITIVCDWGGDLTVGPSGDIGVTQVQSNVRQRVIRRLLTNPGDYIWHTDYGAGLGSYVGEPYSPNFIEGAILNQLQLEALVAAIPAPTVRTNQLQSGSFSTSSITVQYQVSGTLADNSVVLGLGA